jgi:hypothetical protein
MLEKNLTTVTIKKEATYYLEIELYYYLITPTLKASQQIVIRRHQ